MSESRRLRTQAERDADGQAWRATAATRPGYATYPQTQPGSPSWWQRYAPASREGAHAEIDARVHPKHADFVKGVYDQLHGPPPVDGETCKRWCGFCHLGTGEQPPELASGGVVPGGPSSSVEPTGFITLVPPRRRWWHRYTRRNP